MHVVLEGAGNARHGGQLFARGALGVDGVGRLEGKLAGDLEEGVHVALARLDVCKSGLCNLAGAEIAGGHAGGDLRGAQGIDVESHYAAPPSPRIEGTRKKRPSVCPAFSSATSSGRP